ncbi:putative phage protein (TIGR02216 family) [Sphingomonas trueperi]|uniref:phage tail assembly chaperone n=1 Tax=Sphingomonas trueperi TaxID=53317 RepID=UPI003392A83D
MTSFAEAAGRLAGLAGLAFGWSPDRFWRATPAELAALLAAAAPEAGEPPSADLIARLQEQFPDG